MSYDAQRIAGFFDAYGEREWDRLAPDAKPAERVNFEVHRRLLAEAVRPGDSVLEVGAGPGRFTLELARLGARIRAADISPRQLELHREKTAEIEGAVEGRDLADVVDLSRYADGEFDCAVCIGGPVSYVRERADDAIAELARVTRPGGLVVVSVMTNVGCLVSFLRIVVDDFVPAYGLDAARHVFESGELDAEVNNGHHMQLYRWRELRALLERHGLEVVRASAANLLSTIYPDLFDGDLGEQLLAWELEACAEPGALDCGTHIVAVARRAQ
jgi:ubiquinone/menaquinone biosynthesis C-methylase UbiE